MQIFSVVEVKAKLHNSKTFSRANTYFINKQCPGILFSYYCVKSFLNGPSINFNKISASSFIFTLRQIYTISILNESAVSVIRFFLLFPAITKQFFCIFEPQFWQILMSCNETLQSEGNLHSNYFMQYQ